MTDDFARRRDCLDGATRFPAACRTMCEPMCEPLEARRLLAAHATAHLVPAPGLDIAGQIRFRQVSGGVEVKVNVRGLSPGAHGLHVHAGTVCDPNDPAGPFMSAGGHFNPGGEPHGSPDDPDHHAGDLGNIVANNRGRARAQFFVEDVSLTGPDGFAGHALIIHASPDDFETQPTGNSGGRIACGIITLKSRADRDPRDDDGPAPSTRAAGPFASRPLFPSRPALGDDLRELLA